jgi:hypothetical protein
MVKEKPTRIVMKSFKNTSRLLIAATLLALPLAGFAADEKTAEKPKPYTLKICVVSDGELDEKGDMKPYVFTHEGREIKLCCESCLKDFKKDSAKYIKKIEAAEKKAKK